MTYERLIIAVDEVAPQLSNSAYKLLWRLIALAIHRGTPEVEASMRWLATALGYSKESVAESIRELAQYIQVTALEGRPTIFCLPPDWFPPQRTLFGDDRLGGDIHNRPGNQDTTVLFSRTPLSQKPGHHRPGNQDTRPGNQDTTVLETRTPVLISRTQRPGIQDTCSDSPIRNAGARVDRSIDQNSAEPDRYIALDRAFHTVEILPAQRQDAELLSDVIRSYREKFDSTAYAVSQPDRTVLARILAIGAIEEIADALNALAHLKRKPGASDMWFFTVLIDKLLGIHHTYTAERIKQLNAKAQSLNGKPSLFPDQLVSGTAAQMRKLG